MTPLPHPDDTIVALASPPGPAARAIVRVGGPGTRRVIGAVFSPWAEPSRRVVPGQIRLPGLHAPLPAESYFWPGPHTYTGQDLAELHTIGSPPLVELLIAALLDAGARPAEPGEFTLRGFLAGKTDLPRAEAVLATIHARDEDELRHSLAQLAGHLTGPLRGLREDLLDLLAEVEAGLDFSDEGIEFADQTDTLNRISAGLAHMTHLLRQLDKQTLSGRPFRVALVGSPNAGKSSLFNALTGSSALTSPTPGTTRDYLTAELDFDGLVVELIDTAGREDASDSIAEQAQRLAREQSARADLLVVCVAADQAGRPEPSDEASVTITTKRDLVGVPPHRLATSTVTGEGIAGLRELIRHRAEEATRGGLAPSQSRCRHHVEACLRRLRQAHAVALFEDPPELLALELRLALDELGALTGAVYTEDLLGRIFSRFCIGK